MRTPNKDEIFEILILKQTDDLGFGEACEVAYDRDLENDEIDIVIGAIKKHRSHFQTVNKRTRRYARKDI